MSAPRKAHASRRAVTSLAWHGRLARVPVGLRKANASRRWSATLTLSLLGALASAQTAIPGMRKDILGAHAGGGSPVGVLALVQMLVALAVVFVLLRYLLPKVVAKAGKRLVAKVGSPIKIEESAAFGGGMLYVVEVRERTLLLSVGTQGVSCLADLTSTQPPQEPIQTFHEMLEETPTAADPVTAFTAVTPVPEEPEPQPPASTMTDQEARLALERLRKIVD